MTISPMTFEQQNRLMKILSATMLADGSIGIPPDGSKNAKYRQPKISSNRDYITWLEKELSVCFKTNTYEFNPKMNNAKRQIMLQTNCHPLLTSIHSNMYPNGIKKVHEEYLDYIDWEFLSVLFQEDGSAYLNEGKFVRVVLCTESFTEQDNILLKDKINTKLNINFNVKSYKKGDKYFYRLHLNKKDINNFMDGVEPYIKESFKYKIYRTIDETTSIWNNYNKN